MILVDANVFMYAAGAAHRFKAPSRDLLDRIARNRVNAGVDAEVLQEILHRYRALNRWDDGKKVYDLMRVVVPVVVPISAEMVDQAKTLLDQMPGLMARDALHAAACIQSGADALCSYDKDFDRIPGLKRIEPDALL